MSTKKYQWLTLLTCIGMFLVLIAGVMVTNTDSGDGCGTDWPLCNGKFIPAYTLESMVEYTHRFVSGIVGLLVGASFLATLLWKPAKQPEPLWYASASLFFTVLQAALGAMAVKWPQSDLVMALHFGISLFAFTCTWLLYAYAKKMASSDGQPITLIGLGNEADRGVSRNLHRFTIFVLVYCYAVIYLGAYIRHTGSGGACAGWPLCNGEVFPSLTGAVGIAFGHRLAALVMLLLIVILLFVIRVQTGSSSDLRRLSRYAFGLVLLQVLSGGLLAVTMDNLNAYVFTALLHTVIISGLFSVLFLIALRVWHRAGSPN